MPLCLKSAASKKNLQHCWKIKSNKPIFEGFDENIAEKNLKTMKEWIDEHQKKENIQH